MPEESRKMHQDFARWYHAVCIENDAARITARWEGVLNVVKSTDHLMVEALLRLAYGGRARPAIQTLKAIRQAFKDADDAFDMSDNNRELQVLAGATLAVLMESLHEEMGDFAALAATTAALGGARKPDLPMDLAALGETAIAHWGEQNRKRPLLDDFMPNQIPKIDFDPAATKVREVQNWQGVAEAFALAAEHASQGMQMIARRQAEAITEIDNFIRIQDEELQMLWWLIGQWSETYDCTFQSVPSEAQPFVFASELANCTAFLPGPPSVKSILSRAGLKLRGKLAVTKAVNAPPADWLENLVEGIDLSPLSTPLHVAIKRQLETGAGETWIAGWAASTEINAKYTLSKLKLGELFYRERLLLILK